MQISGIYMYALRYISSGYLSGCVNSDFVDLIVDFSFFFFTQDKSVLLCETLFLRDRNRFIFRGLEAIEFSLQFVLFV